ncbi:RNA polymerase sigma-70 factor (ECF subfamily) [Aquimarina sp. MAR_2010_214]|uniref:RNA polymerase sigma factor n=1 Tax=Aquimarina sp. MAR_2010_214 TaxID=1250026 RepID=UPI000C71201A|nr:sigma-70 family RNA polymerase sigma factor [Aquimarina sp. MAR_2010_214]PKV51694.1 RNA polymerase sigma-70 factor (ECF subfamily) [Aquimarina sp. MAR_2010_214]
MINTNKTIDSLLVLQCQSGSKKAVTLLVKRWHTKLCKQAYWYTRDMEISKDIAQDSWSTIFLKINSLRDSNNFGSWALTIVTRNAINWLRKHKKEVKHLQTYKDCNVSRTEDDEQDNQDTIALLRGSIKKLPYNQQLVLNLFYIEEYSIKQISDIINVSTGTVKSRLFTAREKLKLILKKRSHG